jgi:hypothetical protein
VATFQKNAATANLCKEKNCLSYFYAEKFGCPVFFAYFCIQIRKNLDKQMDSEHIAALREAIEKAVDRRMQTPKDFDFLSESIFGKIGERVSPTTLKRLWGYLSEPTIPRLSTLNILAQFVGYVGWTAFCEEGKGEETPLSPIQPDSERPRQRRAWKKIALIGGLLAVVVAIVTGLVIFGRSAKAQDSYILKMGQCFSTPHEYLKLFGIIATDTLWGRPVPHHERMCVWTPEYRNQHWHNYGDSALMMPTITEHWEPEEYKADPELIVARNKDHYWNYKLINELRITFMKGLVDSSYVFLGIYRMSIAQSDTVNCVWERIADQCDLTNLDYLEQLRN